MNTISKISPDLLQERLDQLKKLFPDLYTNGGQLNEDELRNLISQFSIPQTERYEFRWAGKAHSKKVAFTPSKATLIPDKKRSIDFDTTENLIIKGDNLEVLKLLQKSYFEAIKCIYIDPPYNTGNDFIYNDNYSENKKAYWEKNGAMKEGVKLDSNTESIGRYHSNWLNMMQSRLLLARNLLKDDGVIFVSIDDHEVANLRKLMDEVFGEENFLAQFVWKRRSSSALAENLVSVDHEYIVAYQHGDFQGFLGMKKDYGDYKNPDNDSRGAWTSGDLTVGMTKDQRPNQFYDLIDPKTGKKYPANPNRVWAYIPESMNKLINEGRVIFPKDSSKKAMFKRYKNDLRATVNPISTWINNINEETENLTLQSGLNAEGTRSIQEIFGNTMFNYSKPVSLIKSLLKSTLNDKDIVLDFFAGSGTAGQAVMELNKEGGGNRRFILVQLPELTDEKSEAYKAGFKTISDICIERVKRSGEKIRKEDGKVDTGFKVFQLTYSHFPENLFSPDPTKTEEENIKAFNQYLEKAKQQVLFAFEEDKLLYEIALKDGFSLNFQIEKLSNFADNTVVKIKDDSKEAIVCLDQIISDKSIDLLAPYKDQRFICLKRAIDTTKKWNLQQLFEKNLWVA